MEQSADGCYHHHPERITLTDFGQSSAVAYPRHYCWATMKAGFPMAPSDRLLWPSISARDQVWWVIAISKPTLVAIARELLSKAGYPVKSYSSHSYRSGGATDLWNSQRCRPLTIKLYGRWKSDAYLFYTRDNPVRTAAEVAQALTFFDQVAKA